MGKDRPEDAWYLVATAPDLITRRLHEADVRDAVLAVPAQIGDRYATINSFAPAARAWLRAPLGRPFGDAPRRPPLRLVGIAAGWLQGEHEPQRFRASSSRWRRR